MAFPQINILFKSVATTAVKRGNKGIVFAILKDATNVKGVYEMITSADIPAGLSDYNKAQLGMIFQGGDTTPRKVIACVQDSTVVDIAGVGSQIHAIDIPLLQIPCLDKLGKVDKVGVACAGRERLIGRIAIAGRRKGQNLPVMLFARGEKIDEVVGIPAKAADSVWSGQR